MSAARLKELFGEAVELPLAQRPAFLAAACRGDARLRSHLEQLLAAHDDAGDFLAHPTALVEAVARETVAADDLAPGARIGVYQLVERLGAGGFGSVWRARQLEPVTRDVALKILHRTLDAGRVAARFQVERQALARMQHPGIAKVFDAGTTADDRPWLAMELVDGEPITRHCERQALPLARRLALFVDVCLAVQHAHGKGIVHRDLKPSNVLVTERDGAISPVIIDFGVARALDERAAQDGTGDEPPLIGTPDYMSPEQAAADPHAVDTRTDVYSLGVILYELACGQRPHPRRDGEAAVAQLARVRDEVPAPPSRRTPVRLPREIDWLTAKAMAKDPADRYPTAIALADDVRRLLQLEPVLAGPQSTLYRVDRFVRRHVLAVTALVAVAVSLTSGTWLAVDAWQRERATAADRLVALQQARVAEQRERDAAAQARAAEQQARGAEQREREAAAQARAAEQQARADQQTAEREARRASRALALLDSLWSGVDPARLGQPDYPVRELLADFERALPHKLVGEPTVEIPVRRTLARLQYFVGLFASSEAHATKGAELAASLGLHAEQALALVLRARVRFDSGDTVAARADAEEVLRLGETGALPDATLGNAKEVLASCMSREGDSARAIELAEQALQLRDATGDPLEIARSEMQLANLHGGIGRVDVAMQYVRDALASLEPVGDDHPDAIVALQHLAYLEQRRGDYRAAEAGFRESLERRRRVYGDDHPHVAWAQADLAWVLHEQRRDAEALAMLHEALPVLRRRLGESHLYVTEALQRMGAIANVLRDFAEAETNLKAAAERYRTLPGHPADGYVGCLGNLAKLHWARGERELAKSTQEQALEHAERTLPRAHFLLSVGRTNLAYMVAELGDPERAITLLREALERSSAAGRTGEADTQRARLIELLRKVGRENEAAAVGGQGR